MQEDSITRPITDNLYTDPVAINPVTDSDDPVRPKLLMDNDEPIRK
jgi:hypothetical protein